jgi:hypothetical protein
VQVHEISIEDDHSHDPGPGADPYWQESWFLGWYDPVKRAAGFHHVGIPRVRGRADLWHWVALDGQIVARYQNLELPVPDGDMSDFELGPIHVRTKEPLRSYILTTSQPDLGYTSEVAYEAFVDPFAFSLDAAGSDLGKGHYESLGRVRGSVTHNGTSTEVSGFAFQDHSWGARHWGGMKAHRWACATFGDDLFTSIFSFTSERGTSDFGYVFDRGTFHRIVRADFDARVDNQGILPRGADIRVWCDDDRGYRFTCPTIDVASPSCHTEGFWIGDGYGVFECGGRLGTGLLEVQELGAPLPHHRAWLGLDK